jgi:alkylation response protein AidB-like acyl-CoA dehydrogenase
VRLDFALSGDQVLLRDTVRRFAEERIRPGVRERDEKHEFPAEIVREMGELGLLGMMVPEEYGGAGADLLSYLLAVEEVARVCPATAVTMSVTNSVACWPILRFGSEALKRGPLSELASGRALGAFCVTEPGAGSDPSSLRTAARRQGDGWVLDGEKAWITNAAFARYFVVVARTDPQAGKGGLSAFVVPSDAPGLVVGAPEEKLGLRASDTAAVVFEGCRVGGEMLLGEEGRGLKIALATLSHSRLGIAAQALGIHRRALELALAYARERVQFGVPIVRHQAIQFKIAGIATDLAASRALLEAAAAGAGTADGVRQASEAKLFASEAANRAVYESLQIHGGNGYSEEYEIARLYRDVRVTSIYEGTSEMQRLIIARSLLA